MVSRESGARSRERKGSSLFIIFRLVDLASRHPSVSTGWKNGPRVGGAELFFSRSFSFLEVERRGGTTTIASTRRGNERAKERKREREGKKEKGERGKETGEKKKWKTGPVRPRSWKRRREMPVSIIPETMTDRHRYSAGNARTRDDDDDDGYGDDDGDTLTPGINLSKNERRGGHERRQLGIPSSFAYVLLQPGNDAGRRSMDGIEGNGFFLAPSFPTPCLVAAATTALLMDDTRPSFASRSI